MFERLTQNSRAAVVASQDAAARSGHELIDSCDLLLGLLAVESSGAAIGLAEHGVQAEHLRPDTPANVPARTGPIPMAPDVKQVLVQAPREALNLSHNDIHTGHLLLGILTAPGRAATDALTRIGVDLAALRATVLRHLPEP